MRVTLTLQRVSLLTPEGTIIPFPPVPTAVEMNGVRTRYALGETRTHNMTLVGTRFTQLKVTPSGTPFYFPSSCPTVLPCLDCCAESGLGCGWCAILLLLLPLLCSCSCCSAAATSCSCCVVLFLLLLLTQFASRSRSAWDIVICLSSSCTTGIPFLH